MRVSAALPVGVSALLFDSARQRRRLEGALAARLEAAGFSEVILPIVDYFEPYEPLLSPAAKGELYRFVDRDGELLALRADSTPMLARLLAPRLEALALPLRLFYRGDVVRYQEERAGHEREFYELGAELLGPPGERAEHEMLRLFVELACGACGHGASSACGPKGPGEEAGAGPLLEVVLGFAGALDEVLLADRNAPDGPAGLAARLARRERCLLRSGRPALPSRAADPSRTLRAVLENGVPEQPEELGERAGARLRGLRELVAELAPQFPRARLTIDLAEFARQTLDPRIPVSGAGERAYYDGLVFRAFAGAAALPVGGGGRYDRLFRQLGAEVPAVGFSLALDRLLQASSGRGGRTGW